MCKHTPSKQKKIKKVENNVMFNMPKPKHDEDIDSLTTSIFTVRYDYKLYICMYTHVNDN